MSDGEGFIVGFACGAILMTLVIGISFGSRVKDIKKEAVERGYMEKVITEDDRVEYKWVEIKDAP